MSKVTLDRETFKALASETRLDVLHALDERRKTTTEIAAEINLNKATVHEHLKLLEAVGLVKKLDEGRKWIYHELTWDGRKLLHPDQGTVFNVLLTLSVLASAGAVGILGQAAGWWFKDGQQTGSEFEDGAGISGTEELSEDSPGGAQDASSSSSSSGGQESPASSSSPSAATAPESGDAASSDDGSGVGWLGLALALMAVLLINLAIFLRKRK